MMSDGGPHGHARVPFKRPLADLGDPATWLNFPRNKLCPCGSGRKYKHCHRMLSASAVDGQSHQPEGVSTKTNLNPRDDTAVADRDHWKQRAIDAENQLAAVQHLHALVADLYERERAAVANVAVLSDRERTAVAECSRLRRQLEEISSRQGKTENDKFRKLKHLLAKEFSPDARKSEGGLEKTIRAEVFKIVWPLVQKAENEAVRLT